MQPFAKPFDPDSNVNIARAKYDAKQNPWFGKSLATVDFPDWGHPHQVTFNYLVTHVLPTVSLQSTTVSL